jgi:hypothetical protein
MKKYWVVIIILVAIIALMYFLTNNIPQIKEVADQLAKNNKMPIWLVGLLSPIIYFFKSIWKGITNILPGREEEEAIRNENEKIQKELDRINNEVSRIDEWRTKEIDIQMKEIERLRQSIGILKEVSKTMDSNIEKMKNANPSSWAEGKSNKQIFDELDKYLGLQ